MLLLRHVAALSKESMDFPFCLFISIAVDTDFDFVTGKLPVKLSKYCLLVLFGCVMGTSGHCRKSAMSMFTLF